MNNTISVAARTVSRACSIAKTSALIGIAIAPCLARPASAAPTAAVVAGRHHTCELSANGIVQCWGLNSSGQLGDSTTTNRTTPVAVGSLGSGVVAVAAGGSHTCAITSYGGLKCWGANSFGQLGDSSTTYRPAPVAVSGLSSGVVAVSAGDNHTCALTSAGAVKCWGINIRGTVGDGTTSNRLTPVGVTGLGSGVVSVAAGGEHSCAVTAAGAVQCWGYDDYGQLGDGFMTTEPRLTPVSVGGLPPGYQSLSVVAGTDHTCVLNSGGWVWCWGGNWAGQLGDGTTTNRSVPVHMPDSWNRAVAAGSDHTCLLESGGTVSCVGGNASGQLGNGTTVPSTALVIPIGLSWWAGSVATGASHSCAVTATGSVQCWGHNGHGELGDGTVIDRSAPVNVIGLAVPASAVASGARHTCGVTGTGGVKCWGANEWGQLGNGSHTDSAAPQPVSGMTGGIAEVAAGETHSCARTVGGGVKCWGSNTQGQLGDGTTISRSTPAYVPGLESGVAALAAGAYHTCALTSMGGVMCWGYNADGGVGDGSGIRRLAPVYASGLTSGVVVVAAGGLHTCAVTAAGGVKCWGNNHTGELGDGTTASRLAPVDVSGLTSGASTVATGVAHTCAVTTAGGVSCWGANQAGQLGDGTQTSSLTPVAVTGLASPGVSVAVGSSHTCAVTNSGGVQCWGYGGRLGDGSSMFRSTPGYVVGLLSGVAELSVGYNHACALTGSRGLQCWGANDQGQLGDGTTDAALIPRNVMGLRNDVAAVGGGHTCALTAAGGVRCWGANTYGQLGDGTLTPRPMPVDVTGLTNGAVMVAAGVEHTCALLATGSVKCWGRNNQGQLGDGSTTNRATPVDVQGETNYVVTISAQSNHTCALTTTGALECWGRNAYGQLGNGSTSPSTTAVTVSAQTAATVAVVAAGEHTCAVSAGGSVQCWGRNAYGQLGTGSTTDAVWSTAVKRMPDRAIALAGGDAHTCALTARGGVACWGANAAGQLGDGTTTSRSLPGWVIGMTNSAVGVTAGSAHTCVITNYASTLCWGSNAFGQLADGTTTNALAPAIVSSLAGRLTSVAAGCYSTCAVTIDGALLCAGLNSSGQLGDTTLTNRTTPVRVRALRPAQLDFDGDRLADPAVYRPATGTWFSLNSSSARTTFRYVGWGVQAAGDVPAIGDFDGDGVVDPTVFRPSSGTWFLLHSASGFTSWSWFGWGTVGDMLVPGDYDGDRKTDAAIYRPAEGRWYVRPTSGATPWDVVFGGATDLPLPADYDGDGRTDIAVYRPSAGTWFVLTSSSGFTSSWYKGWGVEAQGDVPAPGDFDGDGKADLCVFRPSTGTWFILESSTDQTTWRWVGWGMVGDIPVPADYDGDGLPDIAVYRPSEGRWYVRPSSGDTPWNVVFGTGDDAPLNRVR